MADLPPSSNQAKYPSWTCVIMGVSGCGKSRVGEAAVDAWNDMVLRARASAVSIEGAPSAPDAPLPLPAKFIDGDEYHPRENIEKMSRGEPLNDQDRAGWLSTLALLMQDSLRRGESTMVACSALKHSYRELLFGQRETCADCMAPATPDGSVAAAAAASAASSSSSTASCAHSRGVPRLFLAHLDGSRSLLEDRMSKRQGHFMKTHMLESQLQTLEPPSQAEMSSMGPGVKFIHMDLDRKMSVQDEGRELAEFIWEQQLRKRGTAEGVEQVAAVTTQQQQQQQQHQSQDAPHPVHPTPGLSVLLHKSASPGVSPNAAVVSSNSNTSGSQSLNVPEPARSPSEQFSPSETLNPLSPASSSVSATATTSAHNTSQMTH